jgi:ATP-binding cassette subfamily C exporter for protease/lipase
MSSSFTNHHDLKKVLLSFRREFFWVGIFSFIANVLMLSPTLYMLQIYDRVLASQSELTLLFLTLIIIILFALMAFAEWSRSRLLVRAGVRLDLALNARIFNASFDAYLGQSKHSLNDAFSQLTGIRQFLTGNGIIALFDAPWTPIYIFIIFMLHPLLGKLAIIFALIQLLMAFIGHRMTDSSVKNTIKAELQSKAYLTSKLKNIETVEAMGMVGNLRARWLRLHLKYQAALAISSGKQHQQQALTKFVRYCMQSLTLAAAAMLVIEGELSLGAMIAANVLSSRALQPLDLIVGSWRGFVQAKAAYLQLDNLLNTHPEQDSETHYQIPTGEIALEKLIASSPGRSIPILDNLNVEFKAGQVTAIIGPSGSGKSTLARCLLGIWPYKEGSVLLDKTPIESWNREKLGTHIGYLPQDIELLNGTFAENIGRYNEVDSDKIIDAAKRAGIHEMILRFPMGYDTQAGEAGDILSGGQKQRLGLARAMYGNPSLIVLDEPNANLDDLGEIALLQAIQELKNEGKTVFLITHRRNILSIADYLLVLKEGKIVNYGLRDSVLATLNSQKQSNAGIT